MGDLDGFVQLMVRRQRAVIGGFGALKREIGMEFHHGVARLDGFVRIDLDFVVPLRACGPRQGRPHEQAKRDREGSTEPHIHCLKAP
jgi:hypothetical protein